MTIQLDKVKIQVWSMLAFFVLLWISCSKETIDDPGVQIQPEVQSDPETGNLVWKSTDNTLATHVHFGIGDNAVRRITLYMSYTGDPHSDDITGTFHVVLLKTNAVIGDQVLFPGGKTTTIPSGSTTSEPIHIDIDPTKISGQETLTVALCVTKNGDIQSASAHNEFKLTITKIPEVLVAKEVTLTSPGNNSGHRIFDVANLTPYTFNEANREPSIQRKIDFGFWNSSNASIHFTFIVPTNDARLGAWTGSGRTIRDEWATENKNDGILMKVPEDLVTPTLFDELNTPNQLFQSFDDAEGLISALNPYDYGPSGHIHAIKEGELIFFRSLSRNIHAVAKVVESVSGGSGSLKLLIKTVVEPD